MARTLAVIMHRLWVPGTQPITGVERLTLAAAQPAPASALVRSTAAWTTGAAGPSRSLRTPSAAERAQPARTAEPSYPVLERQKCQTLSRSTIQGRGRTMPRTTPPLCWSGSAVTWIQSRKQLASGQSAPEPKTRERSRLYYQENIARATAMITRLQST